jgi:hypothetical protein
MVLLVRLLLVLSGPVIGRPDGAGAPARHPARQPARART